MQKDYYKILELTPKATEEDIKNSYKRLARKYHPDASASTSSEEKFKEINEAYSTLSDKHKKARYDYDRAFNQGDPFSFNHFFNAARHPFTNHTERKENYDASYTVKISLAEALNGASNKRCNLNITEMCEECDGKGGKKITKCQYCNGNGNVVISNTANSSFNIFQVVQTCRSCLGNGQRIDPKDICIKCKGDKFIKTQRTVTFDIPKYTDENVVIRIKKSKVTNNPKQLGDLLIRFNISNLSNVCKKGRNLIYTVPFIYSELVLGVVGKEIKLIDNTRIKVNIKPGTQPGSTFKIPNKGYPGGDSFIIANLNVPTTITEEHRKVLNRLNEYEKL